MASRLNRSIAFLLTLLLSQLIACKDGTDEVPSLFFASPKNEAIVWNTVLLDLQSSTEAGEKITLFMGDSLVGTIEEAPYTFNLNTASIPDGEYLLKAISSNRQHTAETKIFVRNNLIVMKAESDQLPIGVRGFIFLSDIEGNTFASAEFKNGESLRISGENYSFENFTLSEAYIEGSNALSIYSFQEVPRGEWTVFRNNEYPAIITNIQLDFTDISSPYYFISSSGDAEFLYSKSSMELEINKAPTKLFIREFSKPINHFKIIHDLNPNGRQTISLSDITAPLSIETTTLTGGLNKRGNVRLFGFPTENNFKEYYNLGLFYSRNGEIKVEYPGNGFPVYGSTSFYKDDDITINAFQIGKKSDLAPLKAEVSFKSTAPMTASISTFGDFDVFTATWAYVNEKANASAYWAMFGPSGRSQSIKLPNLPTEVRTAASHVAINELQFSNNLEVSDFGIAKDYHSYIAYISKESLSGPYVFGKSWKEQIFTKSGSTGGRSKSLEVASISNRFSPK